MNMLRRLGLSFAVGIGLLASSSSAQEPPAPSPPFQEMPPADPSLEIPSTFVPRVPRTEADRDRIDAVRAYVVARALEDRRQWNEAIALLEEAGRRDPSSVAIQRRLARLYFGLGRVAEAVESSKKAIASDPGDAETIRRLVRFYIQSNNTDAAESLLKETLDDPSLKEGSTAKLVVLHDLGELYLDQDEFDKAAEPLSRLLQALDDKAATRLTSGEQELILGADPPDAYRRFGEAFYNARRYDLAIQSFRRSLAYEPDELQTPLLLAQSLLRAGRADEALTLLDPILERKPPGRIAYDILAQVLATLGRQPELIPRFEAASNADPKNFLLRYALGEQYEKNGQVDRAREIYRKVIAEQPDPQGVSALADSLRNEGKYQELLQLFETALTQQVGRVSIEPQVRLLATDPEQADHLLDAGLELLKAEPPKLGPAGRLLLVEVANQAGRAEKLVDIDRLNVEKHPSPTAYSELANTLATAGKPAEAAAALAEMIAKFPELAGESRILGNLGLQQFNAGQVEESLATGRKMLDKDPGDFVGVELVGFALNRLGRHDEAITLYRGILARFADNAEAGRLAHIWLSNVYSQLGDQEKAEAELTILLEQDPEDPWVNNDLGYLWADKGKNLERAEEMIRKSVAAEPDNGSYLDSLGWVLFKRDKLEEALATLGRAATIKKADATILDHLGDTYFRLGRVREARESWEKAEELANASDPPDKALPKIREKLQALKVQEPTAPENPAANP